MTGTVMQGRRRGLGAVVFGAAMILAGVAAAQQPPAPATTQAAPQPEPPASTLAAAREVVETSGMARSFAPMVPDLIAQIVPTITRTHPELTTDLNDVVKQLGPEFQKDGERMTDIAAHVFARRMSEADLKATAAFFKSPAGQKYVEVQPGMLDELVVAMQSWNQQLSNIMFSRIREEMAKKGHSLM